MRKFYIFNISNDYYKFNAQILYKSLENIYHLNKDNIKYGADLYYKITSPIANNYLNNKIYNNLRDDFHYAKYLNNHIYNNYYLNESSRLCIKRNYMLLYTTSPDSIFLHNLGNKNHFFLCDFEVKDYFFLDKLLHNA